MHQASCVQVAGCKQGDVGRKQVARRKCRREQGQARGSKVKAVECAKR